MYNGLHQHSILYMVSPYNIQYIVAEVHMWCDGSELVDYMEHSNNVTECAHGVYYIA